ncbi:MAG TPA: EamA family transporter [bacterium]|nr:EamA family transporter [bacterium]
MSTWLMWALTAAFCWGLWAVFSKLAMRQAPAVAVLIWFVIGEIVTVAALALWFRPAAFSGTRAAGFAAASGVAGVLAMLAFLTALRDAPVAVVVPLTALYPVVAIVLGLLVLGEKITMPQAAGAALAIAAGVLLSL